MNNILMNNFLSNEKNIVKKNIILIASAITFFLIMSNIRIAIPYSPVPITGQTLAVLLIALSFDKIQSFTVITMYFAYAVVTGLIVGPTGGYILGFMLATLVGSYLSEKGWTKTPFKLILSLIVLNLSIYLLGVMQLSLFVGADKALAYGMYPFIFGDLIKILIAFLTIKSIWKIIK